MDVGKYQQRAMKILILYFLWPSPDRCPILWRGRIYIIPEEQCFFPIKQVELVHMKHLLMNHLGQLVEIGYMTDSITYRRPI